MKVGNLVVTGIVLGGLYFFFRSASKLMKLDITLSGLKLDQKATNVSETVFNAEISCYNPNTQDVTFKSFHGNIYTPTKTRIGNIDTILAKGTKIAGRATSKVPVRLVIPNANALQTLLPTLVTWLSGGSTKVTLPESFIVTGNLSAENMPSIPLVQQINLKG